MREKDVIAMKDMTEQTQEDLFDQPAINMTAAAPEFFLYSKKRWAFALGLLYPPDLCLRIISNIGRIPFSIKLHFNPRYWALLPMLLSPAEPENAGFVMRFYWLGFSFERPAVDPVDFCCDTVYEKLQSPSQSVVDEMLFVIGF